ncbi:hypothetical protein JCM9140_907 [Halalkalibacter wakoensis JCM 9140]|uniref:Uncharacterized protein n=1 Tax=Halalkalibacter wakoensis JCM 9140 TaxID=1236970 RepID=W4PYQ9_9BACI|nr:hypothetical protein [Halalkalibacter wakoensis]GAE24941.1 hypothetical protein JCM9140_907 [Halalkalibacter wakoensis JCM 9140]
MTTLLFLIESFIPSNFLKSTYSLFSAILLFAALFYLTRINRIIVLLLLFSGSILLVVENSSWQFALLGFGENANLLSLFLLIPLIGTFMSTAGYLTALKEKVQERQETVGQHPYRLSFFLTATMSILLNFGSMAIVKRIADESFSHFQHNVLTLTIMRGFATSMLWSPYFVNVGLVLVLFDITWLDIGGYGLFLACIYIGICILMFKRISFDDDPVIERKQNDVKSRVSSSLYEFIAFCIVLISLSFLFDYVLPVQMLTVVSLLAVVLPLCWALSTRILGQYLHDVILQMESSFVRLKNELAVFISAGFLGMAMTLTEIGDHLSILLFEISFGSVFLISVFLIIFTTLLAQIGIHPVIILIGIGSALSPSQFGVSPEYLALVLLIAWTVSTQLSPFSGQVLMAAKLMDKPARTIVRQNLLFVCIVGVALTLAIYVFYLLGWL